MSSRLIQTIWCAFAVLAIFHGNVARGETPAEKSELPQAPYLNKLPVDSHYDMTESTSGKDKHAADVKGRPRLTNVSITKVGDVRQIVGEFSNGKKQEAWMYQGKVLVQQLDPPDVVINSLEDTETDLPIGNKDFSGLDWLGPDTYKRTVILDGKKCYFFERTPSGTDSDEVTHAWVDVATKLPEAMERQGTTYHFQYSPPPTGPLQLSPAFATAWQKYQGSLQTVTSTAPHAPYLAKLPDFSSYEMTEIPRVKTDVPKSSPTAVHLSHAMVTKTGGTKQIVGTLSSGKTLEAWMYKGLVLAQQLTPPAILITTVEDAMTDLPVPAGDFQDLGWLNAQSYKSEVNYEGKKCYLFEQTSGEASTKEPWRAVIDENTKLPVVLEHQGFVYHFQYDAAPTQELQLSPPFAKAWQNYQISLRSVRGKSQPR